MKKRLFLLLSVLCCYFISNGQFNYRASNASVFQGTYNDLGTSGSNISVFDYDDTCSVALPIGFSFNYNGSNYNYFVASTNGLIKLTGSTGTILQPDTNYSSDPQINIIAPYNTDLTGGANPQLRYALSGSSPNRVLTVQFKDFRDYHDIPSYQQYSSINFQVKLYEGSNNVDFIYGTFVSSGNPPYLRPTCTGIKGNNMTNSVNAVKSSLADYSLTTFIDGPFTGNRFNNRNTVLPSPGLTLRFISAPISPFDLKVDQIFTLGEIPVRFGFPHTVSARIKNVGTQTVSNVACMLRISGANSFEDTAFTPSIAPGSSAIVSFRPISAFGNQGFDSVFVKLAPDSFNLNNSLFTEQKVGAYVFSYANSSLPIGKSGFGLDQGVLMNKYYYSDSGVITSVRVYISNDPVNIGMKVYGCIQNLNGVEIGRSDSVILTVSDLNKYRDFTLRTPLALKNQFFYAGLAQYRMNNIAYYPIAYQDEGIPARPGTYYSGILGGGLPIQESPNIGRFMIQAVINDGLRPFIVRQPQPVTRCAAVTDSIKVTASGVNLRYRWFKNGILRPNDTLSRIIFNPLSPADSGLYQVRVYNALDSITSDTVRVRVYPLPSMTSASAKTICSAGNVALSLTSTVPGAVFSWIAADNPNITGESLSATAGSQINNVLVNNSVSSQAVTYTVSPSNNGCAGPNQTVTVTVNPVPVMTGVSSASTCSGIPLNVTLISSITGSSFSWYAANNPGTTGESLFAKSGNLIKDTIVNNSQVNEVLQYTVTPTAFGCSGPAQILSVTVNLTPRITGFTPVNPTGCGTSTGSITLTGLYPSRSYSVKYIKNSVISTLTLSSDASGSLLIPNLSSGIYSNFQVTLGSCVSNIVGPITLSDPQSPGVPVISTNSPICSGSDLTLSASVSSTDPAVTYQWAGPDNFSSTLKNIQISAAGTKSGGVYTVIASLRGCNSPSASAVVQVDSTPVRPVAAGPIPGCTNNAVTLTASFASGQAVTWSWTGPNFFGSNRQNPTISNPSLNDSGLYTVVARSAVGNCPSASSSFYLSMKASPVITGFTATNPAACGTASGFISLSGLFSDTTYFVDYFKNGQPVSDTLRSDSTGKLVIDSLSAALYSSIRVRLDDCPSAAAGPVNLSDPNAPPAPSVTSNSPVCEGGSIRLSALLQSDSAVSYIWVGPAGFNSTQQSPSVSNAGPGNEGSYSVSATVSGCTSPAVNLPVQVYRLPVQLFAQDTVKVCGSSYQLIAQSGFSAYRWSNGVVGNSINVTSTGWYSCSVNQDTCRSADSVFVSLVDGAIVTNDTAVCKGTILVLSATANQSVSGNANPIRYLWSNGASTSAISVRPLASTSYKCTISNGITSCRDSVLITIKQPSNLTVVASSCSTYLWNNNTYTLSGNYSFYSLNAAGCDSIAVLQLTIRQPTSSSSSATACDRFTWNGNTYIQSGVYFYVTTNSVGCDSVASLNLNIKNSTFSNTAVSSCNSYSWNGSSYTSSGTYTFTSLNAVGCDSFTILNLTINRPTSSRTGVSACVNYLWNGSTYTQSGTYTYRTVNSFGCDSTALLDLIIKQPSGSNTPVSACVSYLWNGSSYTQSGFYTYHTLNAAGCDSTAILSLTIRRASTSSTTVSNCVNYTWNGSTYTQSGTYTYRTLNSVGCDSVASLILTIKQRTSSTTLATSCVSYSWNGSVYTQTGVYSFLSLNRAGCDSTAFLELTIKPATSSASSASSCETYLWNGITYTQSGQYTFRSTNSIGCDSSAILNLTIRRATTSTTNISSCVSYTWNGVNYTQSGFYSFNSVNAAGCDSMAMLNLTIKRPTSSVSNIRACVEYPWNGNTYTQTGTYTFNTVNAAGCDSLAQLNLTIDTLPLSFSTVSSCVSYSWNGSVYTQSGTYSYRTPTSRCDSIAILILTIRQATVSDYIVSVCDSIAWNGMTYTQSGIYSYVTVNAVGCDSTARLILTIRRSTSSVSSAASCNSYVWNGNTYNQTGIYTRYFQNAAGCDSMALLNLTIKQPTSSLTITSACVSYLWNGATYTQSGTYSFNTINAAGCDSLARLSLTIDTISGSTTIRSACINYAWNGNTYSQSGTYSFRTAGSRCDSVAVLVLTINQPSGSQNSANACDAYLWNGNSYTQSGQYSFRTTNAAGCDSLAVLNLIIRRSTVSEVQRAACSSYSWNGNTYTQSGTYTFRTLNAAGCDSAAILRLTINRPSSSSTSVSSCNSYTWNGVTYLQSGIYTYHALNAAGCDSAAILNLIIRQPTSSSLIVSSCNQYDWLGSTYTQSGTYTRILVNSAGCDSVVSLLLTIRQESSSQTTVTACISYSWKGNVYTQSGQYSYLTTNAAGCDSTVLLNLTIRQPTSSQSDVAACSSYSWNGITYTQTGQYSHVVSSPGGCDSTARLNLTIRQPSSSVSQASVCGQYTWNGITYTQSGTYTFNTLNTGGCDSAALLILSIRQPSVLQFDAEACVQYPWNGIVYTQSGTYTFASINTAGCDSFAILHLVINQPTSSGTVLTACEQYSWNGVTYTQSGLYTYNAINAAGCDSSALLDLTITRSTVSVTNASSCSQYVWNGATYTQSGSYSFNATNSAGCDSIAILDLAITGLSFTDSLASACGSFTWRGNTYTQSGNYSFTLSGSNGCDSIIILNLTVSTPPTVTVTAQPIACFGGSTNVLVSATRGLAPYSGTGIFNQTAGSYTYTVTDAAGCRATDSITLAEPSQMTSFVNTTIANQGLSNGSAYITVSGGTPPYAYSWSNGATGDTARNLAAGNYSITVTDAAGCVITNVAEVRSVLTSCKGYVSYSQESWGNSTAGIYSSSRFSRYFQSPSYLTIGCSSGNQFIFTNQYSLNAFLPAEGTVAPLPAGINVNPGSSSGNMLAGEVLALTLNTVSDSADPLFSPATPYLKDLEVASGPFAGFSVKELLDEANDYLGGCSSSFTGQQIYDAVRAVNLNFEDGRADQGYLICLPSSPEPDMDVTRFNGDVSVYPNPTYGPLVVRFEMRRQDPVTISMYDSKGALVYKNDLGNTGPGYVTVQIAGSPRMSTGVYLLKVVRGDQVSNHRVMVGK